MYPQRVGSLSHAQRERLAERPSEVEAVYLETVKTVQKKISGKKKP